jgi:putative nucleotidyltransferase with HDIG domain
MHMPEMNGLNLLKHVRAANPECKFILMTGQKAALDANVAEMAVAIGANEFLAKPFRVEHLKAAVAECFDPKPKPAPAEPKESIRYCKIPVREFVTSSKLVTDLYIRLSGEKYVKIAYAGTVIPVERLQIYMDKKVEYFYVLPDDLKKLVGLNLKLNEIAAARGGVPKQVKLGLLTNTAKLITQSYYYDGIEKENIAQAAQVIDNTLNIISDDEGIMSLLSFLQSEGDKVYAHSVAVSVYSCLIAKQMGHTSTPTQFKMSMAGLLHDVGKKELPSDLINKTRLEMTAAEVKLYETHPQRGKEILSQIQGIPDDVIQIVSHHHETLVGTGFPYFLAAGRIHPLAKILAVADFLITTVSRLGANNLANVREAVKKMRGSHALELDQDVVTALVKLFADLKLN